MSLASPVVRRWKAKFGSGRGVAEAEKRLDEQLDALDVRLAALRRRVDALAARIRERVETKHGVQ